MKLLISSLSILTFSIAIGQPERNISDTSSIVDPETDYEMDSLYYGEMELYEYIEPEKTIVDSLLELSIEDQLAFVKKGVDPNQIVPTNGGEWLFYREIAHSYGFLGIR